MITFYRAGAVFTLGAAAACSVYAAEPPAIVDLPVLKKLLEVKPDVRVVDPPKPDFSADIEARKSYLIYLCRQRPMGNSGRKNTTCKKRSDHYRHRRNFSG